MRRAREDDEQRCREEERTRSSKAERKIGVWDVESRERERVDGRRGDRERGRFPDPKAAATSSNIIGGPETTAETRHEVGT